MGKKKKRGHRLYAFVVIVLGIAIIVLATIVLFYVQKIEITGNEYTKDTEIIEVLQEDPASVNTLYILGKYHLKKYEMPGSLDSYKISLSAPWGIKVAVKEKPIVGFVYDDEGYVYLDKDGTVVSKGREVIDGVLQIEGIAVSKTTLYETLECEDKKLLQKALDATVLIKEQGLAPDRILCQNGEIYLYFGEICVALGNSINENQIAQITPILEKLTDQSGTLHLEYYEDESSTITFNVGELPGSDTDEETPVEDVSEEDVTSEEGSEEEY